MENQFIWQNAFLNKVKSHQLTFDLSYADTLAFLLDYHIEENDVYDCKTIWEWYQSTEIPVTCQYVISEKPEKCLCFMSLGEGIDHKMDQLQADGHILQAYILECFSMELLRKAYGSFAAYMEEMYDIGLSFFHFLDETEMQALPDYMAKAGIQGIACNESLAFLPQKTVVFYCDYEHLMGQKQADHDKCGEICQYCVNTNCPNRKKKEEKTDISTRLSYGFQRIFSHMI